MNIKEIGTPKKISVKNNDRASLDINRNFNNVWLGLQKVIDIINTLPDIQVSEDQNGDINIRVNGKNKKIKVE